MLQQDRSIGLDDGVCFVLLYVVLLADYVGDYSRGVSLEQQSPNINPKNTPMHQNDLINLVFMGTYALCSFAVVLLLA